MSESSSQTFMERIGATPGKLALIGVLAIVLGYVILSQIPWGASSNSRTSKRAKETEPSTVAGIKNNSNKSAPLAESKPWPTVNVNSVVAHDPFAPPLWTGLPAPSVESQTSSPVTAVAAERSNSALEKLVESGVAVVVIVDGERLALIGDRQVRVGDRLEGFLVTAITESQVVLSGEGENE